MIKFLISLHRDLGYFFAGIVIVYAISGIALNHRNSFNPNYSVDLSEFTVPADIPLERSAVDDKAVTGLVKLADDDATYSKHYFSGQNLKVLLRGGSSITVDTATRKATYEKISQRIVLGSMVRLHFNPGSWWTWFSDIFAVSLIIITISGLFIAHGKHGLIGRGGILLILGLLIPLAMLIF